MMLRDVIRNLLYPPRCRLCGALCGWEEETCHTCREQLPQAGDFFREPEVFGCRELLWCARYEGVFRRGMEQLKFEGVRESLPLFGGMLAAAVRQSGLLPGLTAVTYVPMPPERERHRGYNQSRLLAEQLAKELGLPLREGVLARDGRATAHAAEGRAARIALAQESYRASSRRLPPGEHILLIDDIITTGATIEKCAGLLKAQGAGTVTAAAVLRTPRPEEKKPAEKL